MIQKGEPMKQKIFLPWLLCCLSLVLLIMPPGSRVQADTSNPIVKLIFLYSSGPECSDCQQVLEQDLPLAIIQSAHPDQVEILAVDISKTANEALYKYIQEKTGQRLGVLPVVIIGNSILSGRSQILADLDEKINNALDNGGVDYVFVEPASNPPNPWIIVSALATFLAVLVIGILSMALINKGKKLKIIEERNRTLEESDNRNFSQEKPDLVLNSLLGLAGGSSVDLLSEAQRILYLKNTRSADETVKDANGFLITLLRSVVTAARLRPIAAYRQIVLFDERYHTCYSKVIKGEQVRVIETGWVKGNEVIKKAVVEKK
jgi:hypothetical protein